MHPVLFEILKWLARLGFRNIKYMALSANNVGLPQERRRWFLLAHSDAADLARRWRLPPAMSAEEIEGLASKPWNGEHGDAIPLREWLLPDLSASERERLLQLGNAVVPVCARVAATYLANNA